jgi:alpha-tubulin suppressor-like RCC1 family protein
MELAIEPDGYLEGITAIDAGSSHCMALMEDGTVWTWGRGSDGQLGNNSTGSWSKPVQVWGQGNIVREPNRGEPVYLENITAIAAGYWHSVALMDDGTVWTWGNGYYGQMGDGSDSGIREIPVQVWAPGSATDEQSRPVINYLTGITAITAGDLHTMALNEDSNVFTWGYNDRGQLGIGEAPDQSIPVQVWGGDTGDAFLGGVTVITAGFEYTAAIKADGSVWAWGRNDYGQLGDGTEDDKDTPVQVVGTP